MSEHFVDNEKLLIHICLQDSLMLGSDYPFLLGEHVPGSLITGGRCEHFLSDGGKRKLLSGNALRFFGGHS